MRVEKIEGTPYEDLYKIYNFNPKGKQFDFFFTKDTCCKLATGICALEAYKNDLDYPDYRKYCEREDFDQCVRAYLSLKNNITIGSYPVLHIHKCGHYGFTDGQHRICVALQMNMQLEVEFHKTIIDEICETCAK